MDTSSYIYLLIGDKINNLKISITLWITIIQLSYIK